MGRRHTRVGHPSWTTGYFVDLPSGPLAWVGMVTIGPPVVDDLEDRVIWTKTYLNGSPVLKENRVFCGPIMVDKDCDHRSVRPSVRYERSLSPGRLWGDPFTWTSRVE